MKGCEIFVKKYFYTILILFLFIPFVKINAEESLFNDDLLMENIMEGEELGITSDDLTLVPEVTIVPYSYTRLSLSWNKIALAESYQIYRSTSLNGTYSRVATLNVTDTENNGDTITYIDKSLKFNKVYYYKVRCYYQGQEGRIYGGYSTKTSKRVSLVAPTITVESETYLSNIITWESVSGAQGYNIYVYDNGNWKYLGYTTKTKYNH